MEWEKREMCFIWMIQKLKLKNGEKALYARLFSSIAEIFKLILVASERVRKKHSNELINWNRKNAPTKTERRRGKFHAVIFAYLFEIDFDYSTLCEDRFYKIEVFFLVLERPTDDLYLFI